MLGQAGVFVLQGDQSIVSMQPAQFAAEDQFQDLIARFPVLLVGDQVDPKNPRRWVLVKREQAIGMNEAGGGRWSIDHVFLDQDGIPTLVEIKRQTDTRIRREVVGQMLDYAANCGTFWTADLLRSSFEQTCVTAKRQSEVVLKEALGEEVDLEGFWPLVDKNLSEGRLRLLFVADVIPVELRRIVEFLNRQMSPAEVLAIELRQFEGQNIRTIVPMVFGQATQAAGKQSNNSAEQQWTVDKIIEKIASEKTENQAQIARYIIKYMGLCSNQLIIGPGKINGSVYPLVRIDGVKINPAYLSADGHIYFGLGWLKGKPIFGDVQVRMEMMKRFGAVAKSKLTEVSPDGYPSLSLSTIEEDAEGLLKIENAFTWLAETIRGEATP